MTIKMYRYPPYFYNNFNKSHHLYNNCQNKINEQEKTKKDDVNYISFLGFSIYFDDLLIIMLLFILYNEKTEDKELLFCLVLLLLS